MTTANASPSSRSQIVFVVELGDRFGEETQVASQHFIEPRDAGFPTGLRRIAEAFDGSLAVPTARLAEN
jgi:hypothetical protein